MTDDLLNRIIENGILILGDNYLLVIEVVSRRGQDALRQSQSIQTPS